MKEHSVALSELVRGYGNFWFVLPNSKRDQHSRFCLIALGSESNLQAAYSLPVASNATERGRLDARHRGLTLCLNGLYPSREKVRAALQPRQKGPQTAILDVGTGAGNWFASLPRIRPVIT